MTGLSLAIGIKNGAHFLPPPYELGSRHRLIAALIDDIIHFAAKGVQRGDRPAPFGGQIEKAVVKTGAALDSFFLAILFWGHGYKSISGWGPVGIQWKVGIISSNCLYFS